MRIFKSVDLNRSIRAIAQLNNMSDPTLERTFRGHRDAITAVAFEPTTKQIVSSSKDASIMVWNFKPQLRAYRYAGHTGAVNDVAFSPTGSHLASGGKDGAVRLWLPTVKGNSMVMRAHSGPVRSVAFASDGNSLLTASDDKSCKIWTIADLQQQRNGGQPTARVRSKRRFQASLLGHSNWVNSARFSPDGSLAVSGSDDKTVRIWDVASHACTVLLYDHSAAVKSVDFEPITGTSIASGSTDKTIKLWDLRVAPADGPRTTFSMGSTLVQHYADAHDDAIESIKFHPSGNFLLSASRDSTLRVWDIREGHLVYTLRGHAGGVTACAFSQDGDFFASGSAGDNTVMVWRTNFDGVSPDEAPTPLGGEEATKPKMKQASSSRKSAAARAARRAPLAPAAVANENIAAQSRRAVPPRPPAKKRAAHASASAAAAAAATATAAATAAAAAPAPSSGLAADVQSLKSIALVLEQKMDLLMNAMSLYDTRVSLVEDRLGALIQERRQQ
tara:strand:- start:3 stop:1511 length:1509 start_codon:yes stop_codon:yes gene_type:complete